MAEKSHFDFEADDNILANALLGTKRQTFWEALGRFIEAFALLEAMMFYLLSHRAGVQLDVAKAVFSGTRVDAAMDLMRRINESRTGDRTDAELEDVFVHIAALLRARNDIVHFGPLAGDDNERLVTNALKALTGKQVKSQKFSTETLQNMTHDAFKATIHIALASYPEPKSQEFYSSTGAQKDAWRYKPPQLEQKPRRSRNRAMPKSPARQRPSSRT